MSAMKAKSSRVCGKMFSLPMAVVMAGGLLLPFNSFNWWLKERGWASLKNF